MNIYRKIYTQNFGSIPKDGTGRTYDIHHQDGNHSNNSPENLRAVTIQEHFDIHYSRGDWLACQKMAIRMKTSPEEISRLGSLAQRKLVAEGKHNLLSGEIQRRSALRRAADGTNPFSGPANNNKRVAAGTNPFQHPKPWQCEHCHKEGKGSPNYNRWHGDNCRSLQRIPKLLP